MENITSLERKIKTFQEGCVGMIAYLGFLPINSLVTPGLRLWEYSLSIAVWYCEWRALSAKHMVSTTGKHQAH